MMSLQAQEEEEAQCSQWAVLLDIPIKKVFYPRSR